MQKSKTQPRLCGADNGGVFIHFINIGLGKSIDADCVRAIFSTAEIDVEEYKRERPYGDIIDLTGGKKARTLIIMDTNSILSDMTYNTVLKRIQNMIPQREE